LNHHQVYLFILTKTSAWHVSFGMMGWFDDMHLCISLVGCGQLKNEWSVQQD